MVKELSTAIMNPRNALRPLYVMMIMQRTMDTVIVCRLRYKRKVADVFSRIDEFRFPFLFKICTEYAMNQPIGHRRSQRNKLVSLCLMCRQIL